MLFRSRPRALVTLADALYYDHTLEYVATGQVVPATWLWRILTRPARSSSQA